MLAVAVDRGGMGTGKRPPFLGGTRRLPSGIASLAARTGALVIPGYAVMTPDGYRMEWERAIRSRDARALMARLIASVERAVRRHPTQWFSFSRDWNAEPAVSAERSS